MDKNNVGHKLNKIDILINCFTFWQIFLFINCYGPIEIRPKWPIWPFCSYWTNIWINQNITVLKMLIKDKIGTDKIKIFLQIRKNIYDYFKKFYKQGLSYAYKQKKDCNLLATWENILFKQWQVIEQMWSFNFSTQLPLFSVGQIAKA